MQVTLTIVRDSGQSGQVNVQYTTTSSVAEDDADFIATSGWVTFSSNQNEATVSVLIINDDLPEPPEVFYVNLTRVELIFPTWDSYNFILFHCNILKTLLEKALLQSRSKGKRQW